LTQQIPWYQVPAYVLGTAWYGRFVEKASHGHSIRLSTRSCTRYHTRPLLNNRKEACIAPPVAKVVCPGYSDTGRLVSYRALTGILSSYQQDNNGNFFGMAVCIQYQPWSSTGWHGHKNSARMH